MTKLLSTGQGIIEILETYCKHHNKFGVYISIPEIDFLKMTDAEIEQAYEEIFKACPPLKKMKVDGQYDWLNVMLDRSGILLYETREEQQEAYWSIVGDDGPTESNLYDGPVTVYALTINNLGQAENENT
jgi:hypothetical protein